MRKILGSLAVVCAVAVAAPTVRADVPNFNKRGNRKAFVEQVAETVVKTARKCKDVTVKSYKYKTISEGRTDLMIEAGYKGFISGKPYTANIVIHLNTAAKGKWSVLSIEYKDNNKLKLTSKSKIEGLVSKFNEASK